ncbi:MAG: methionyl-tRNA formyltransferase [Sphingomonadaceae bacterium]|nr:methionyl-tRNA formyltransferase [Sphingomonadaceae bacterium]
MRIIFMGTPDFAVPALKALTHEHDVVAAYCQPPRPAGRGKKLRASPVQQAAEALGIEVRHPASLKSSEEKAAFAALDADVAVVAAYGLILNQAILDAPRHGCLNIHGSLLPRWRGAAPVQRAIEAGDTQTGVTIMQMERGLDTGPMRAKAATIVGSKTAGELTDELAVLGADLTREVLRDFSAYPPDPQDDAAASYAEKIGKAEALLDFTRTAAEIERAVRAYNPVPGAFFETDGERIKIWESEIVDSAGEPGTVLDDMLTIACGERAIRPVVVQRAGKSRMAPEELLRGFPIAPGTRLG